MNVEAKYKVVETKYVGIESFRRKLAGYAEKGWRVVSVFRPDESWHHHVVVVLEQVVVLK